MQIYDVTNPYGFFCQSKADVKCQQHLLKNHIEFAKLSIISSASTPVTTCHSKGSPQKRNVQGLSSN